MPKRANPHRRRRLRALLLGCLGPAMLQAGVVTAELNKETVEAFERYVRSREGEIERRGLWVDESADRRRRVRGGGVVAQALSRNGGVPGGLIHDWIGAAFIPGVTLDQTLALVRDYDRHDQIYSEVIDSKILSRDGQHYKVSLRLLKKKVLTVVLNTEHDVTYSRISDKRWHSRSYSTRIAEVENYGERGERELPVGKDHGFLWRLYSYWKFEERDGGVYVECEAISLTRDVPSGLGWLIRPIVRDLPAESLRKTLEATRDTLLKDSRASAAVNPSGR